MPYGSTLDYATEGPVEVVAESNHLERTEWEVSYQNGASLAIPVLAHSRGMIVNPSSRRYGYIRGIVVKVESGKRVVLSSNQIATINNVRVCVIEFSKDGATIRP